MADVVISEHVAKAISLVLDIQVLGVVFASAIFGLFVGAIPGLTATMAAALLVPMTFFMPPLPALGAVVAVSAMAIFAGDLPAAMLRMPGTPASAAYAEESYAMALQGKLELNLSTNLVCSVAGGLVGVGFLMLAAPWLAEVAIHFSSFEYFWLSCLGLSCASLISGKQTSHALLSLLFGLGFACVGIDPVTGVARFTGESIELAAGIHLIPSMIGAFALSELMRSSAEQGLSLAPVQEKVGALFSNIRFVARTYWQNFLRGSLLGTAIGALPGAGADVAAWISYAMAKRFSKQPEQFGKGHLEGIVESTSSNNAALGGAWIPALVFGIPGDSVTAIVIGVLYMKGMNPGPSIFSQTPDLVYALFLLFILANLLMLPLGWLAIKLAARLFRTPRALLLPMILMTCVLGSYAMTNSSFGIVLMLFFGILAWLMESHDIPIGPMMLGIVLGGLLEQSFMTSMIKADGHIIGFFERPIAAGLSVITLCVWSIMLYRLLSDISNQNARRQE